MSEFWFCPVWYVSVSCCLIETGLRAVLSIVSCQNEVSCKGDDSVFNISTEQPRFTTVMRSLGEVVLIDSGLPQIIIIDDTFARVSEFVPIL